MKRLCVGVGTGLLFVCVLVVRADVIFSQPPVDPANWPTVLSGEGKPYTPGVYQSSGNGSDYDRYVSDNFTPAASGAVTEISWRGGYDPYVEFAGYGYNGGYPVLDFKVSVWTQAPNYASTPLAVYDYDTGIGNAGETPVGTYPAGMYGSTRIFDYDYVLPTPFNVTTGTEYWLKIEGFQSGVPDWGLAVGAGSDNQHYSTFINYAGGTSGAFYSGDTTFTLLGTIPEPATLAMVAVGALLVAGWRRRRVARLRAPETAVPGATAVGPGRR